MMSRHEWDEWERGSQGVGEKREVLTNVSLHVEIVHLQFDARRIGLDVVLLVIGQNVHVHHWPRAQHRRLRQLLQLLLQLHGTAAAATV